jgi:hypothetical protein
VADVFVLILTGEKHENIAMRRSTVSICGLFGLLPLSSMLGRLRFFSDRQNDSG